MWWGCENTLQTVEFACTGHTLCGSRSWQHDYSSGHKPAHSCLPLPRRSQAAGAVAGTEVQPTPDPWLFLWSSAQGCGALSEHARLPTSHHLSPGQSKHSATFQVGPGGLSMKVFHRVSNLGFNASLSSSTMPHGVKVHISSLHVSISTSPQEL